MTYFKTVVLPLLLTLLLTGCLETVQTKATVLKSKTGDVIDQLNFASVNKVMSKKNDFDNSVHKYVKTAAVYRSQERELDNFGPNAHFALGASWSSASPDTVLLVARMIKITRPFTNIEFNVGGKVIKLNNSKYARDGFDKTQIQYYNKRNNQMSMAFYKLSRAQFNTIVNDGKAKIRIYYGDGFYNGDLGIEKARSAIVGLRNLQAAISD